MSKSHEPRPAAPTSPPPPPPPSPSPRTPSEETFRIRLRRNRADPESRIIRINSSSKFPYDGSDTILFWTGTDELNEAPFPFLEEIKDDKIRKCIRYLKNKGYTIIAQESKFNPKFLATSSKNTSIKKKKKKKGGAARTRRAGRTRRS
tara:strand:- start:4272 stop:4715 length:444 start_codon:yes stop_codon:yes gene_type:complete